MEYKKIKSLTNEEISYLFNLITEDISHGTLRYSEREFRINVRKKINEMTTR